jgi:hypothetical protein
MKYTVSGNVDGKSGNKTYEKRRLNKLAFGLKTSYKSQYKLRPGELSSGLL